MMDTSSDPTSSYQSLSPCSPNPLAGQVINPRSVVGLLLLLYSFILSVFLLVVTTTTALFLYEHVSAGSPGYPQIN